MPREKFGGPWTIIKLGVLQDYINFYTTALKRQGFTLIYIDSFAGTGSMEGNSSGPELFEQQPLDGSAKIALSTIPSFDKYIFIEESESRLEKLKQIEIGQKDVSFHLGDANLQLLEILSSQDWSSSRAVLFLDPYGLGVTWETLLHIASTKAIDLWYLVNTLSMSRQLAKDFRKLEEEPYKAELIDRCWGETAWRDVLYTKSESLQATLFEDDEELFLREGGNSALDTYCKDRLKCAFPYVSDPKRLTNTKGHQLF